MAPAAIDDAMGLAGQLKWEDAVGDAVAALGHLRGRDEVRGGTGLLGFYFGGGLAFNVAAEDSPDALVSYYGSSIPDLLGLAPSVNVPSLHHFGLDDAYIDRAAVERIRTAVTADGRPAEFEVYEGANHAFDNDDFAFHHPERLHSPGNGHSTSTAGRCRRNKNEACLLILGARSLRSGSPWP